MSVYNGENYLKEAIESILNQTFRDFEFIIINDGSTDSTGDILARYQQVDNRILVYKQENRGLIASLNRGCQLAKGKYIARMDADDISLPERLAREVNYLETHPDIGVLGTWMEYIDENSVPQNKLCAPTTPNLIKWFLLFGCPVAHPSVMIRRDTIETLGLYRPEALHAEDYDLWSRASLITRITNMPEILLQYRTWEGNISSRQFQIKEQSAVRIMHSTITRLLGPEVPLEEISSLRRVLVGLPLDNPQQIDRVVTLVQQLYRAYLNTNSLSPAETREVAQDAGMRLLTLAASTTKISPQMRFFILARALRLSPSLFWSRRVITKGVKKAVRMLMTGLERRPR